MANFFHDPGDAPNVSAASGRKICIATTAYDSPDASYTFSMQRTREWLHKAGYGTEYMLLSGNCHVDDARNTIVQEFLLTDCTDLVFIDADVSWEPADLMLLCIQDCDVVGGVYPFRRDTAQSKMNMPVRMIPGLVDPDESGLIEVEGLPAGFLRIRRHVLEMLAEDANRYWNRADRRLEVPILFERTYSDDLRMGGDLAFCAKWRAKGGKVHAVYDLRLGHTAKTIVRDSLGAALRRQGGETLRYVAEKIRSGVCDQSLFTEALRYVDNPFAALEDVLVTAVTLARQADGPIIEAGSGLTTILMKAAAPDLDVYCLEHDPLWAEQLHRYACQAHVENIGLCLCPIRDGWYELTDYAAELPDRFALGLNDGPPRTLGSRMGFYKQLGDRCDIILADDADDRSYGDAIEAWCEQSDRRVDFVGERAAIIRRLDDLSVETAA